VTFLYLLDPLGPAPRGHYDYFILDGRATAWLLTPAHGSVGESPDEPATNLSRVTARVQSPPLVYGDSFSFTFTNAGTFAYRRDFPRTAESPLGSLSSTAAQTSQRDINTRRCLVVAWGYYGIILPAASVTNADQVRRCCTSRTAPCQNGLLRITSRMGSRRRRLRAVGRSGGPQTTTNWSQLSSHRRRARLSVWALVCHGPDALLLHPWAVDHTWLAPKITSSPTRGRPRGFLLSRRLRGREQQCSS